LKKIIGDPEFIQIAKKQSMDVIYMSPEELLKVIERGVNLSPSLKNRFKEILAKYQPKK
jgi:tripartite-type tricarboxylate transporter receptor subunit TctC